jgi:hypothetical protein
LQGFLLQVEVSEIVLHEADEPNALVDFFDAESLELAKGSALDIPCAGA